MAIEILYNVLSSVWTIGIIGFLTSAYFYFTWHFDYWKKQGVNGPPPWPIIGNVVNPFKAQINELDREQAIKYGKVIGIFEGRKPALMVSDPDILKTILVKDFHVFTNRRTFTVSQRDKISGRFLSAMKNEEWKHLRNIITPVFTTGKMKQMIDLINNCSQDLVAFIKPYAEKKQYVDMTRCLSAFTLDVIACCAFGTNIHCLENQDNEFVRHATTAFNNPPKALFIAFIFPKLAKYLPPFMPKDTTDYFDKIVQAVVAERGKEKEPRKDFLQAMLNAKQESDRLSELIANGASPHDLPEHYALDEHHVLAQSLIFILAGFETTSTTLAFLLYNLALQDDIQDKLIDEIDGVLGKYDVKFLFSFL